MITPDDSFSDRPLYVPTRGLSRLAASVFVLAAALCWTAAGYDLGEMRTLARVQQGAALEPSEHLAHEKAGGIVTILQVAATALVAVAFVPWLHMVRCNLRAFGVRRLRFGRQWTYLGFLVPGLNLFRPHQVVSEVWRGSHADPSDPVAWQHLPTPPLVSAWWGALVAFAAMEIVSSLLLHFATGAARIQLAHGLALGGDACAALSASLGFLLVTRIQRAQEAQKKAQGQQEARIALLGSQVVA